ncbi:MAG: TrkH family potassium uptake protein [Bacteroidales bacterium]|jgi:trk system potassium uptake protein TrkH|nr:TrkH family potassium uptake protein [Bacteroidales bacterium]
MFKQRLTIVCKILAPLLFIEALLMLISLCVGLSFDKEDAYAFIYSIALTGVVALLFYLFTFKEKKIDIDNRSGFLVVSLLWIIVSFFGCLPYFFGGYLSFTDSFFESISGFTTTGASIIKDVESIPKGIMFWRCLTNGIGGIGIVVIIISFLPSLSGGGTRLFSAETAKSSDSKLSPRTKKTGKIIIQIYISLNIIATLSLYFGGMSLYDAVCHSFSALSSGGFSTKNASLAAFSPLLQYIIIVFMFLSGVNFNLIYFFIKKQYNKIWCNEEFRTYLIFILVAVVSMFILTYSDKLSFEENFRAVVFQGVSILSSTGLSNADFFLWSQSALFILFLLMFCGAMSGSTTGGLKLVRIIILFKNAKRIIMQSIHSKAITPVKLNGKIVDNQTINNVLVVFLLFMTTYFIGVVLLLICGVDIIESSRAAISSLANMGYSDSESGSLHYFPSFSIGAKWVCISLMYLGRLELVTVVCLFMPSFWKN